MTILAIHSRGLMSLLSLCALLWTCTRAQKDDTPSSRPNVLLIFTDQQNASMMSVTGNPHLRTPTMDRLARNGVLFEHAYCTSPVCGPARSSILSGRMPHETGVEWNGDSMKEEVVNAGEIFRRAGYHTVWAGKWHLPESYPQRSASKQKEIDGFDLLPFYDPDRDNWMLGTETDPSLTDAVVGFLEKYESDKPFFMGVSYHNPHDICFYARKDGWMRAGDSLLEIRHYGFEYRLPDVIGMHPDTFDRLPPLPANHGIPTVEPEFIKDKRRFHNEYGVETKLANEEFGEMEWRGYYHAYCRLTEMADTEIGRVLRTVRRRFGNTIIVFTSDHGDGAASHQWAAKLSLYEESSKIPMIIAWPGHIPKGRVDRDHLVSQIDILPTLCDYAGIGPPVSFTGRSWRPVIEDPKANWRDHLVVELADYKPNPRRMGRMVRTERYKYNVYSTGRQSRQLFDLVNDPGEMCNLAVDPAYSSVVEKHHRLLIDWTTKTADAFAVPVPLNSGTAK